MPRNQVVRHLVVPTSVRGATVCSHTGIALGRVTLLQVRHRTRTSGADRTHESLTDSARTVALHRLSGLHLEFEQWVCNASLLLVDYTYLEEPPGISLDAERSTPACTHGIPTDRASRWVVTFTGNAHMRALPRRRSSHTKTSTDERSSACASLLGTRSPCSASPLVL